MTFYRIAAGAMWRKRLSTLLAPREGKTSGTSRRAHTSTSTRIYTLLYRFAIRAIVDHCETFIWRNGHDQTRSSQSRITAVRGELSAGSAPSIQNASEIISQRDRNYPSQSLVGNISAGWHTKTRTDVRLPTNGWDGEGHGRYWSRDIVCTFPRMHRVVLPQVTVGPSWTAGQSALSSTWRYLFVGMGFNHPPCSWLSLRTRIYPDRYIGPYYRNYSYHVAM